MPSGCNRTVGLLVGIMLMGVLLVCGVSIWRNASMSPADVRAHAQRLHNQTINVHGRVANLQCKVSQRAHAYYTFSLEGDGKALTVFAFGAPHIANGQLVTVQGKYAVHKDVGPWTFRYELDATYGSIIRGKSTPERLRERFFNWLPHPVLPAIR